MEVDDLSKVELRKLHSYIGKDLLDLSLFVLMAEGGQIYKTSYDKRDCYQYAFDRFLTQEGELSEMRYRFEVHNLQEILDAERWDELDEWLLDCEFSCVEVQLPSHI